MLPRLLKNRALSAEATWTLIGIGAQAFGQALLLKTTTTLLPTSGYGVLVLANSVNAWMQMVPLGSVVQAIVRAAPAAGKRAPVQAILQAGSRILVPVWWLIGGIAITLGVVGVAMGRPGLAILAAAGVLLTIADFRTQRAQGLEQALRERRLLVAHRVLDSIARAAAVFVVLSVFSHPAAAMAASGIVGLAVATVMQRALLARLPDGGDGQRASSSTVQRQMVLFALPLAVTAIASWGSTNADRWIIERVDSIDEVGRFAVATSLGSFPFALLSGALMSFGTPILYARADRRQADVPRWVLRLVVAYAAAAAVTLVALTFGSVPLISLLASRSFKDAAPLVPVVGLAWAVFHLGQMFALGPMITNRTRLMVPPVVVGAVVSLTANAILVPRSGGAGAAWAFVIGASVRLLVMVVLSTRALRDYVRAAPAPADGA